MKNSVADRMNAQVRVRVRVRDDYDYDYDDDDDDNDDDNDETLTLTLPRPLVPDSSLAIISMISSPVVVSGFTST
jgi:hypothetical protein